VLQKRLEKAIEHIQKPEAGNVASSLSSVYDYSNKILSDIRHLSRASHPHLLDQVGFEKAVESLMQSSFKDMNIEYSCHIISPKTSRDKQQHLYRIIQECINNTLKHADASECLLVIKPENSHLFFLYRDDGDGFDIDAPVKQRGFGLVSIQERTKILGGSCEVISKPGSGVSIKIKI